MIRHLLIAPQIPGDGVALTELLDTGDDAFTRIPSVEDRLCEVSRSMVESLATLDTPEPFMDSIGRGTRLAFRAAAAHGPGMAETMSEVTETLHDGGRHMWVDPVGILAFPLWCGVLPQLKVIVIERPPDEIADVHDLPPWMGERASTWEGRHVLGTLTQGFARHWASRDRRQSVLLINHDALVDDSGDGLNRCMEHIASP